MKLATGKEKQSTRDTILYAIKKSHAVKVDQLAEAADISPITVRHHLNGLMADGFIESKSVRMKVGRPFHVYSLTEKGQELFPKKYFSLMTRLLDEIKDQLPKDALGHLFTGVVEKIVEDHRADFEHIPFEAKLDYVVKLLAQEGFLAEWQKTDDGYRVIEYSCPYLSMGHKHAEVCNLDKELMISVLNRPINQQSCMMDGDEVCHFIVEAI